MNAFHGESAIKTKYVNRMKRHIKLDRLVRGTGWDSQTKRGCAVGCTLNRYSHSDYEKELGIPRRLAYLEDRLFETMSVEKSRDWPLLFLQSINVGADLSPVWARFNHWLLVDPTCGVLRHATTPTYRDGIKRVAALFARQINGEAVLYSEFSSARKGLNRWYYAAAAAAVAAAAVAAAAAADADAAAAAAAAAAAVAADAAADADAAAAADAADAAADADAADAADAAAAARPLSWRAVYSQAFQKHKIASIERQADKLLELLEACR